MLLSEEGEGEAGFRNTRSVNQVQGWGRAPVADVEKLMLGWFLVLNE